MSRKVKRLRKKVVAVIFIITIGTLTLNSLNIATATGRDGHDRAISWNPNYCDYCECYHFDQNVWYWDTMAGIGVLANYDMSFNDYPAFGAVRWTFDGQAGMSTQSESNNDDNWVALTLPIYYTICINYNTIAQSYYDGEDSNIFWGPPNGTSYYCWNVHHDSGTIYYAMVIAFQLRASLLRNSI